MFAFSHKFPRVKTTYPRVKITDPRIKAKDPKVKTKDPSVKTTDHRVMAWPGRVKHYLNKMTWSYLNHFKVGRIIALICISLTLYGGGCVFIVLISQLLGSLVGNAGGVQQLQKPQFLYTSLQVYICTSASGWWLLLSS